MKILSGYSTLLRNKALPGTLVPAMQRSFPSMTRQNPSMESFPLPTSSNVPTMALTMLRRNLSAWIVKTHSCVPVCVHFDHGLTFEMCMEALKLGVYGGIVFTATTWVYSSIQDRISSGPAAKAAPLVSAFGVYLAIQALMGMFL